MAALPDRKMAWHLGGEARSIEHEIADGHAIQGFANFSNAR